MRVPTRKVTNADGQAMVINVQDYDPKIHLGVEESTEELEAPELEAEGVGEASREVAPADGSEFNFDVLPEETKKQDLSAVVPGPELPKA